MRECRVTFKWLVLVFCGLAIQEVVHCEGEKPQWSKPEQNIQNNDWVPVQGKCPTCRPNRDLEGQSTNEQIGHVLTPPKTLLTASVPQAPGQSQQLQFSDSKQPRFLPLGPNFPQYNNPFVNSDNKQFQTQSMKLYAQEPQKPFYQFESPFVKQAYALPSQQLIPQSPVLSQASIPQQRFPVLEPYPFTLPLKNADATTTPKVVYQPKIRFPDSEPPKLIPNDKITSQTTDEIQLLYVPIEASQRGRKNMKEIFQQNQFQQNQFQQNQFQQNQFQQNQYQSPLPHGFIAPQYNFQYSSIPKQPENQFYFPSNIPPTSNYLQLNQVPPPRPEPIYPNLTKPFLQPYFTINGLYSPLSQVQSLPNKQPEIPYYNLVQPGLFNTNPAKPPEQVFKSQQPIPSRPLQPIPAPAPVGTFIQSNIPNTISTFADVYAPTTTEVSRSTDYATEKTGLRGGDFGNKASEFSYPFVTSNPQTSASQSQHFISDNRITSLPQNTLQFSQTPSTSKSPQKTSQAAFEETTNVNYPVPHQPPLSFYMEKVHNPKINDVLYLLKDAKTIPVLDTVETDPPQVFVGPSELPPPKGYIKFELPYLSSLDYNRIERMIDRLPFFVAPLNFKPPPGYSKIPFPAPHIGSVVLSNNTNLQESLHDKPFESKYKQTSQQSFSTSPELSTITPQLTSQINSLLDTQSSAIPAELTSFKNLVPAPPPAQEPVTFKNYGSQTEKIMKKPFSTSAYKSTTSTTEQPKRAVNRQRKPIFRGYPTYPTSTTTETAAPREITSTTESAQRYHSASAKENENYVGFTAKGKFNINNGNDNLVSSNLPTPVSTAQASSGISPTYQSQADYSNFYSTPTQNPPSQNENIGTFEAQKSTQNVDYYVTNINSNADNQNYPYYNPQTTIDTKSVSTANQVSNSEPEPTQSANFNFNNVKPLSQYNPFNKEENHQVNNTADVPTTKTTDETSQNLNDFNNFWTQNQFYKVNPNTVDFFSSTTNYPQETSSAIPETSRPSKATTEAYQPEPSHVEPSKEPSSTEYVEPTTPTTHRPRIKQRIYPNRYHPSKHTTTEKENVDGHAFKANTKFTSTSDSTYESSSPSSDMLSQSTENHESSTKTEVKPHRRRRPIRPQTTNIVTPVTEVSSSTSRSFRTRPTRHPTGVTERYRPRRPTTSSESTETLNSEWSSYNNFVPSAPATNEISVPADSQNNEPKYSSTYWTDSSSSNQASEVSSTTESVFSKSTGEGSATENPWLWSSGKESESNVFPYASSTNGQNQFTVENAIENQTETVSERKDESYHSEFKNTYRSKPHKSTTYEETSSTSTSPEIKESSSDEPVSSDDDSASTFQDTKKDRFSADTQKKAHDPQDEKKSNGKRRLAFVRRIRKRPQDVLETAESQNLGRITDNSLKSTGSKIFSKTEDRENSKPPKLSTVISSSTSDDVASTEPITEREDESATSPITSSTATFTASSTEADEYAMQNNFAQMLSDFLNSNDHSTKTVNNLERNNVSTENSISYILSLSNNDSGASIISNSSSINASPTTSPTFEVTNADDVITITNSPVTNSDFIEHSTTPEEFVDTYSPNKSPLTSTTTEISLETEICYRGKCVKTKKSKASDLLPVE